MGNGIESAKNAEFRKGSIGAQSLGCTLNPHVAIIGW